MSIILGIVIGVLTGIINSYLLYLTVKKSLILEKNKGRKFAIIGYLIRFIILTCVLILVVKLLGRTTFIATAVSLIVVTLISPFRLFFKS
ncbi:MAG: ATP synthase subunit I [Candidatus Firestonebacteria bacterium]